jgi:hypothetical protein
MRAIKDHSAGSWSPFLEVLSQAPLSARTLAGKASSLFDVHRVKGYPANKLTLIAFDV